MKMGHTKQFCRIPRWVHTHAEIQSRKHTLTTLVENHALTTPAAAESGGGGPMGRRGHAQIHPDIFVKATMEMYIHDMAMELDQDLEGEAKRAFQNLVYIYIYIYIIVEPRVPTSPSLVRVL